jgi:membrane-associated phospholipid phosphatase
VDRAQGPQKATRPTELALAAFLLLAAFSVFLLRPPSWEILLGGTLLASAITTLIALTWADSPQRSVRMLRALAPMLLFPALYDLTGRINVGLSRWILDGPLERFEARLFDGQPSLFLSERLPWLLLSEFLHLCYFLYYFLVPLLPVVLTLRGRDRDVAHVVRVLCLCFLACLACYIWLPLSSPLFKYPLIGPPLSRGFFYQLNHSISAHAGVLGGAFPSSHASMTTLGLLLARRYSRGLFWITLLPAMGLLVATVYCRYHFAMDTIAGVIVGTAFFLALGRRRDSRGEA